MRRLNWMFGKCMAMPMFEITYLMKYALRRLRLVSSSAQSELSVCSSSVESLNPWQSIERPAKTDQNAHAQSDLSFC